MSEKFLIDAVHNDNLRLITKYLDKGFSVDLIDETEGASLLMIAIENKSLEAMTLLINRGANVNYERTGVICESWTPIFHCLSFPEGLELLLKHGANPDHQLGYSGETMLHHCSKFARDTVDIAEILLNHNADLSIQNHEGKTPVDTIIESELHGRMQALFQDHILKNKIESPEDQQNNLKF